MGIAIAQLMPPAPTPSAPSLRPDSDSFHSALDKAISNDDTQVQPKNPAGKKSGKADPQHEKATSQKTDEPEDSKNEVAKDEQNGAAASVIEVPIVALQEVLTSQIANTTAGIQTEAQPNTEATPASMPPADVPTETPKASAPVALDKQDKPAMNFDEQLLQTLTASSATVEPTAEAQPVDHKFAQKTSAVLTADKPAEAPQASTKELAAAKIELPAIDNSPLLKGAQTNVDSHTSSSNHEEKNGSNSHSPNRQDFLADFKISEVTIDQQPITPVVTNPTSAQPNTPVISSEAASTQHPTSTSTAVSTNNSSNDVVPAGIATSGDIAASAVLNSAKLIEKLNETEIKVGLRSPEFGSIEIRTAVDDRQLQAHIAVEHGGLKESLTAALPDLQRALSENKLGYGDITIQQHHAALSDSSSGKGQQSADAYQQTQRIDSNLNSPDPANSDDLLSLSDVSSVGLNLRV